jgi:hypothetical protein
MSNLRAEIQGKATGALLQYAVLRIESALVVAGTILLSVLLPQPFSWWPGFWLWLILGFIAWAIIIVTSVTDPMTSAKVLWQLLRERLDLGQIKDSGLRGRVDAMSQYIRDVEVDLNRAEDAAEAAGLGEIAGMMYDWVSQAGLFARYVDTYRRDYRLEKRRGELPGLIETLVARLKYEKNPEIVDRLNAEMEALGKDWQSLKLLDAQMQQAEPQLNQSLTALARSTSEMHVITAERGLEQAHLDHLKADVQRHYGQMADLVTQVQQLYTKALEKR